MNEISAEACTRRRLDYTHQQGPAMSSGTQPHYAPFYVYRQGPYVHMVARALSTGSLSLRQTQSQTQSRSLSLSPCPIQTLSRSHPRP